MQRPADEPGFRLDRQEAADRQIRYTLHPYAADRPRGERYAAGCAGATARGAADVTAPARAARVAMPARRHRAGGRRN